MFHKFVLIFTFTFGALFSVSYGKNMHEIHDLSIGSRVSKVESSALKVSDAVVSQEPAFVESANTNVQNSNYEQASSFGGSVFDKYKNVYADEYIFADKKDKNFIINAVDSLLLLGTLGRNLALLSGTVVIASSALQYRNYLSNPLQTRLMRSITTLFAGCALIGISFLTPILQVVL